MTLKFTTTLSTSKIEATTEEMEAKLIIWKVVDASDNANWNSMNHLTRTVEYCAVDLGSTKDDPFIKDDLAPDKSSPPNIYRKLLNSISRLIKSAFFSEAVFGA